MADLDFYAVAIRQIQEDLIKKLEEVIPRLKKLSDTEMINVAQQIDFMTELDELGYGRLLDRMNKAYEDEILRAYRELSRARVAISSSSAVLIDQLRSFDMEYLNKLECKNKNLEEFNCGRSYHLKSKNLIRNYLKINKNDEVLYPLEVNVFTNNNKIILSFSKAQLENIVSDILSE